MSIRWGIIGVGDVTERKSGPGFSAAADSELVAVMRRDGAKAADYARRHHVPRWYDDADALIHDPEVDAVYIATPPDSHADYAIRVAAAGKPVYVEKPMARTATECDAMIAAAEAAGVPLFVAHYRRTLPRFVAATEAIQSGRLGEIHSVRITQQRPDDGHDGWRLDPQISGGGHFVDLASHQLDWLDHLLGPLTDVHGTAIGGPPETRVAASFGWPGILGLGLWDFASSETIDELRITGSTATLTMSSFGTDAPVLHAVDGGTETLAADNPDTVQLPLIENIVQSLLGRAEPVSTGVTARRTAAVIDQILAGHRREHGIDFG